MREPHEQYDDTTVCEETLSTLRSARSQLLIRQGVNRQAARLFALLESEKRRELARIVGADAALLAKLEWTDRGSFGMSLRLVLDDTPDDLSDRFIFEFEPFCLDGLVLPPSRTDLASTNPSNATK